MAKILVVDDNIDVLDFVSEMLDMFGHSCVTAEDGKQALEVLKNSQGISLVVTDINMPVMTGIELTIEIKKQYKDIPVIIMTGYGDNELIGRKIGDEFIRKPFEIDDMMELIEKKL